MLSPSHDVNQRIIRVVSDVFGVPLESVSDETSPDTVPTWESVSHINLVLALEAEFGISLTPEEAMDMLSVGLVKTILAERGIGTKAPMASPIEGERL